MTAPVRSDSSFSIKCPRDESSSFDAVLTSRDAPSRKALGTRAAVAAVAIVTLAGLQRFSGIDASGGAFAAVAAFVLLLVIFVPLVASGRVTERVTMANGVIRISRYVGDRLIDQRRLRTLGLGVDCHDDACRNCTRVELLARDRKFEIARHLTPSERSRFVERFLEALRRVGAEPRIRRTLDPQVPPATWPSDRIGLRSVSRFRRAVARRRIGCRASAGPSVSFPPETYARHSRPAADDPPPGFSPSSPTARKASCGLAEANASRPDDRGAAVDRGGGEARAAGKGRVAGFVAKWRGELWSVVVVAAALSIIPALQMSSRSSGASSLYLGEPSFRLTASSGEAIDDRALIGRPYAVFFGFTKCPEVCPTTLLELTRALKDIGPRASQFDVFFVTLDPERDTPEVLSEFTASFGPRFVGLSGSAEEVARAAEAFRVYHRKVPLEGGGYTIDHTTFVYLVDRRGREVDAISFMERQDIASRKLKALILDAASDATSNIRHTTGGGYERENPERQMPEPRTRPLRERRSDADEPERARDKMTHIWPQRVA